MDHPDMSPADTVDNVSPKLSPVSGAASSSSSSSPLGGNDLEQIIEHITNVYLTQTPLTPEFVAALPDREKQFLVCIYVHYVVSMFTSSYLCFRSIFSLPCY